MVPSPRGYSNSPLSSLRTGPGWKHLWLCCLCAALAVFAGGCALPGLGGAQPEALLAEDEAYRVFVSGRAKPLCQIDCLTRAEGEALLGTPRALGVQEVQRGTDHADTYYLLGRAAEALGHNQTALKYYAESRRRPEAVEHRDLNARIEQLAGRRAIVVRVQEGLKKSGFDPGPADGVAGRRTREAIAAYSEKRGIPPDLEYPELLVHLESAAKPSRRGRSAPRLDRSPPRIETLGQLATREASVSIEGHVSDRSGVESFEIDGEPIDLDDYGNFWITREIEIGASVFELVAIDGHGNRVTKRVHVARSSHEPDDRAAPGVSIARVFETTTDHVAITGQVQDASGISQILVGGESVRTDDRGRFRTTMAVPLGRSEHEIAAVDDWGNRSEQTFTVLRSLGLDIGNNYALVIGNNTYADLPDLVTAAQDALAVKTVLEGRYGFRAELLVDATRAEIIDALGRYRASLTEGDNLLIYYAGHGVEDAEVGQGYWLPVDSRQDSQANWLHNAVLRDQLKAMKAKHVMLVADSCYSARLVRGVNMPRIPDGDDELGQWLEGVVGRRSRTVLTSGGLEPVGDGGGSGGHSVFAAALLRALRDADKPFDGQALYDRIKRPVVVNADQTPQYSDIRNAGHEGGDFVFAPMLR